MGFVRAGIAAFLIALALAPAAHAAQRYAAPAGSGTECTQAKPCSLNEAMGKAKANDEVIVTSGTYAQSGTAFLSGEATGASVHGDFSGPRPTITGAVPGFLVLLAPPKSRIAYLNLVNTASSADAVNCPLEGAVERVRAEVTGANAIAVLQGENCVVRDSLLRADGETSLAINASGVASTSVGTIRNVTAIATGPKSVGLRSMGGFISSATYTANVRNSILSGGEYDLQSFPGFSGPGNIDVAYSNFDVAKQEPGTAITQGPGNQSAPPQFVNAPGGDYREAAGSPTIDAGIADQLGSLDLDGNARLLGSAPDIGAYEIVPPPVLPAASGEIQSLALAPKRFRAVNAGEAIFSAKKKAKAPIGTSVTYSLSAAATVTFSVERKLPGRKVGKRCVKPTKANREKKRCSRFKSVKGTFTHPGQVGQNRFKFSARIAGKGLRPGSYRLVGRTGSVSKTTSFKIVK
jgi:hypothetical protein